jgi:ubiquinone/menaquinone biosynthesis C-methylase UbiE
VTRAGPEYDLWQELATRWDRRRDLLWGSTRQVSEWLVDRLDPRPGETILELAAGTGETGFLAAARLAGRGRLISSDRSPNMVEAARRAAVPLGLANVEFRVLDAEALDLPDASVDGVLSRFGYLLKGDPPPALAEARRVLRPGGRLAFAVWAARDRNPWMTVPRDAMAELGHLEPRPSAGRDPLEGRSPERIRAVLAAAGFEARELAELPAGYRFRSAEELWTFVSELRGEVALAIEQLAEEQRAAVRAAVESRAGRTEDGGYELAGTALAVLAC